MSDDHNITPVCLRIILCLKKNHTENIVVLLVSRTSANIQIKTQIGFNFQRIELDIRVLNSSILIMPDSNLKLLKC